MFALLDICVLVRVAMRRTYMSVRRVRASPGANILAAMFALLDICVFR